MEKIIEIWDTEAGLLAWNVFLLGTGLAFEGAGADLIYVLIGIFLGSTIFYISWKYARSIGVLRKKINIIFVLHSVNNTPAITNFIKNFQDFFNQRIAEYKSELPSIKVKYLPQEIKISSKEEAERFIQKGYVGHTLLVWGKIRTFSRKVECSETHFTYEFSYKKYHPKLSDAEVKKNFAKHVDKGINSVLWDTKNLNSAIQFDQYAENIYDVSIYVLALTLMTVGEIRKADTLLTNLIDTIIKLNPQERLMRAKLFYNTKEILSKLYLYECTKLFTDGNLKLAEEECQKAIDLDSKNYEAHVQMAYFKETIHRDEKGARKCISEAASFAAGGKNTHIFSEAYLDLKSGRYTEAINLYRILENKVIVANPVQMADYMRKSYTNTNKIEFLFGEGLIKSFWLDDNNVDGNNLLRDFIEKAESDKEKYKLLILEAERIISA